MLRRNLGFAGPELHVPELQGKIITLKRVTETLTCITPARARALI